MFALLFAFLLQPVDLDRAIREAIGGFEGQVFIYAKNIDTGVEYGLRADERVRTASTIKLAVMAGAFAAVAEKRARWTDRVTLTKRDTVGGSGVLKEFTPGLRLPLRDVLRMMIVVSDNTGTNLVLSRVPADYVNAKMDKLGLRNTRVLRKVLGRGGTPSGVSKAGALEENKPFGLGVSTPREIALLIEKMERGEVVNAAASKEMIAILKRQQYKDGIGRHVADESVASKSGSLDALRSDVGIVYGKNGRVAIAITVDGMPRADYSADNAGNVLISRLTGILRQYLDGR